MLKKSKQSTHGNLNYKSEGLYNFLYAVSGSLCDFSRDNVQEGSIVYLETTEWFQSDIQQINENL